MLLWCKIPVTSSLRPCCDRKWSFVVHYCRCKRAHEWLLGSLVIARAKLGRNQCLKFSKLLNCDRKLVSRCLANSRTCFFNLSYIRSRANYRRLFCRESRKGSIFTLKVSIDCLLALWSSIGVTGRVTGRLLVRSLTTTSGLIRHTLRTLMSTTVYILFTYYYSIYSFYQRMYNKLLKVK